MSMDVTSSAPYDPSMLAPEGCATAKPIAISSDAKMAIDAMMSRMTLDDKLGQIFQVEWRAFVQDGVLNTAPVENAIAELGLGSVLGGGGAHPMPNEPSAWIAQAEALQAVAERSATGLPLLNANDSVHGQVNLKGATLFPHHIGQGCMRDESGAPDTLLVEQLAGVAAKESYACGLNWIFSPCVAVPRDIRWGRTYEGFGEEPDLVGQLGAAEVRGLQSLSDVPVMACLKHWVADGGTELGTGTDGFGWTGAPTKVLDQGDSRVDEAELRDVHVAPYLPGLEAGCLSVMISYSSVHGSQCHGEGSLINTLLKQRLGFQGIVITDYDAVEKLYGPDRTQLPLVDATAKALNAGVDVIMISGGMHGANSLLGAGVELKRQINHARDAVTSGSVPMSRIDDAVRRVATVKHALGLGAKAATLSAHPSSFISSVGCNDHRALARKAVAQSATLLLNKSDLLPVPPSTAGADMNVVPDGPTDRLRTAAGRVIVTGPGAHDLGMQCGGWSGEWQGQRGNDWTTGGTTIWEAISATCDRAVLCLKPEEALSAIRSAMAEVAELKAAAAAADVVKEATSSPQLSEGPIAFVVCGERPYAEGGGDTHDLTLEASDLELINNLADSGARVVVLLLSGRPLFLPGAILDKVHSLVALWLPGTEGGGVADVLFGSVGFTAKTAFSWPSQSSHGRYEDRVAAPRFPYGFGLTTRSIIASNG